MGFRESLIAQHSPVTIGLRQLLQAQAAAEFSLQNGNFVSVLLVEMDGPSIPRNPKSDVCSMDKVSI
jgi:hypothetical protein